MARLAIDVVSCSLFNASFMMFPFIYYGFNGGHVPPITYYLITYYLITYYLITYYLSTGANFTPHATNALVLITLGSRFMLSLMNLA